MIATTRHRFIVCYDIREPKRLRKTHEVMLGFGDPLQYSVFVCDLSKAERLLMEDAVKQVVKLPEDFVHIIDLGPAYGRFSIRIRSLGHNPLPAPTRHMIL
jgi:CRISPR-associated protein Cas2